jgi:hypothetical protein
MRYLTYNPFRPPFTCFLQANSEVMSTQGKRQRLSTRWADARPLRRVFLTTVTPPLEKQQPHPYARPSCPDILWYSIVLPAAHQGFNTHRVVVGPRFSPTDF